jgi:hypothetical protein
MSRAGTYYWSAQAIDASFAGFALCNRRHVHHYQRAPNSYRGFVQPGNRPESRHRPPSFVVGDYETSASNLLVTASSSSPNLVPILTVDPLNASNRFVSVVPAAGFSGTNTITVTVTDASGLSVSTNFNVMVEYFSILNAGLPGTLAYNATWADYNNDGQLDVLATGPNFGFQSVLCHNPLSQYQQRLLQQYRFSTDRTRRGPLPIGPITTTTAGSISAKAAPELFREPSTLPSIAAADRRASPPSPSPLTLL